jgi:hypothetical protein
MFLEWGMDKKRLIPVNYDIESCKTIKRLTSVKAACKDILNYATELTNCDAIWFDMECNSIPNETFKAARNALNKDGLISITLSCRCIEPTKQLSTLKDLYSKNGFKFQGGGPYAGKSGWVNMVHSTATVRLSENTSPVNQPDPLVKSKASQLAKVVMVKSKAPQVTKKCNLCHSVFKNVATASKFCCNDNCSGCLCLFKGVEKTISKQSPKETKMLVKKTLVTKEDIKEQIGKYIYLKDAEIYNHNTRNLWKNMSDVSIFKVTKPYYGAGKYVVHPLETTKTGISFSDKSSMWTPNIEYVKLHEITKWE